MGRSREKKWNGEVGGNSPVAGHWRGREIGQQCTTCPIITLQLHLSLWTALGPASWSGQPVASWSFWSCYAELGTLVPESRVREVFFLYISYLPLAPCLPPLSPTHWSWKPVVSEPCCLCTAPLPWLLLTAPGCGQTATLHAGLPPILC